MSEPCLFSRLNDPRLVAGYAAAAAATCAIVAWRTKNTPSVGKWLCTTTTIASFAGLPCLLQNAVSLALLLKCYPAVNTRLFHTFKADTDPIDALSPTDQPAAKQDSSKDKIESPPPIVNDAPEPGATTVVGNAFYEAQLPIVAANAVIALARLGLPVPFHLQRSALALSFLTAAAYNGIMLATWATYNHGGMVRLITSPLRYVPRGVHGGVSAWGFGASAFGGALSATMFFIGSRVSWVLGGGWGRRVPLRLIAIGTLAGVANNVVSSVLGGWVLFSGVTPTGVLVLSRAGLQSAVEVARREIIRARIRSGQARSVSLHDVRALLESPAAAVPGSGAIRFNAAVADISHELAESTAAATKPAAKVVIRGKELPVSRIAGPDLPEQSWPVGVVHAISLCTVGLSIGMLCVKTKFPPPDRFFEVFELFLSL